MTTEILLVIGQSGAGKSTVLHVFEDMRLFTADGVPLPMLPDMVRMLLDPSVAQYKGLALGVDQRRTDFLEDLNTALEALAAKGIRPRLLFLEADASVLMRRYATTRRPHPLERQDVGLEQAILEEAERLAPVREQADLIIDTTNYSIHDLRRDIQRRWTPTSPDTHSIKVNVISFGFKYGVPREADMVFDLRSLPNPYFTEQLRPLSGKDETIAQFVFSTEAAKLFRTKLVDFLLCTLPQMDAEGRYRVSIAIGCTGGRHRSVAMAEHLEKILSEHGYSVSVEHRHMELG